MFDFSKISDKQAYFVYSNQRGELSKVHAVNVSITDHHLQGVSLPERKFKTFRLDRVVSMHDDSELLSLVNLDDVDASAIKTPPKHKVSGIEIHFTGFSAADKKRLQSLAIESGMTVRQGVTSKLDFLCCGKNAGPSKTSAAVEKGAIAITEDQLIALLETGEIPESGDYDVLDQEPEHINYDDVNIIRDTFSTMRSLPRRQSLIAIFTDRFAAGWAFAVHECHRPALDIKLTPITSGGKTFNVWTQGHAFNFIGGELIHSHKVGHVGPWSEFIEIPNAVTLSVKFSSPSGFDTVDSLDGTFTGTYRRNNASTDKGAREQTNIPLLLNSQTYDEGLLTIDVHHSDGKKLFVAERITLTQVEFVTMLQFGSVVRSVKDNDGTRLELYSPFPKLLPSENGE